MQEVHASGSSCIAYLAPEIVYARPDAVIYSEEGHVWSAGNLYCTFRKGACLVPEVRQLLSAFGNSKQGGQNLHIHC
jgi:hypothetical protein